MESFPSANPAPEKKERSYDDIIAEIRNLNEGDVLTSKSGTYRTFLSKGDNLYTFERAGADGKKSVETMTEEQLIAGLSQGIISKD